MLNNRNRVIACIVLQCIDIIKNNIERMGKFYSDNVDAQFDLVELCVRESCNNTCGIQSVAYKEKIEIPDLSKNRNCYSCIMHIIASRSPSTPTVLTEDRFKELFHTMSSSVMECTHLVIERMKHMTGILSIRQLEILKSIRYPMLDNFTGLINWDKSLVKCGRTSPIKSKVDKLAYQCKAKYLRAILRGEPTAKVVLTAEKVEE